MKKYKRKTPLISPLKIAIAVLYAAIATAIIIIFLGTDSVWHIICGGITVSLFISYVFIIISTGGRYRYSDKSIDVLYQSFAYKKIDYSWYSAIVISNASYNNGFGFGVYGNIPMQYKVRKNNGSIKVTFPFITLHKSLYPIDKFKSGMNSRDLFMLNHDEIYCLGICWFDSLEELLKHTDWNVYILEDVYLRFKGQFDAVFSVYEGNLDRYYIINDCSIKYQEYMEINVNRKDSTMKFS